MTVNPDHITLSYVFQRTTKSTIVSKDVMNLGDLRALVADCDNVGVPDETEVKLQDRLTLVLENVITLLDTSV